MTWQTALSSPKQENNEKEVNGNLALPDAMGRECIMGICKNAIDPFNNPILNTCVKCERTDNASLLGYSVTGVALNSATVLTAKYYDDYQFKMQNGTLISNSSLNYEANSEFGERYTTSSQGLQTGNATARLDKTDRDRIRLYRYLPMIITAVPFR